MGKVLGSLIETERESQFADVLELTVPINYGEPDCKKGGSNIRVLL